MNISIPLVDKDRIEIDFSGVEREIKNMMGDDIVSVDIVVETTFTTASELGLTRRPTFRSSPVLRLKVDGVVTG